MKKLDYPIIILNFKNYAQATGKKAFELAKIAEEVSRVKNVNIAICPQTVDIRMISEAVDLPLLAQHVDANDPGSHTGNNLIEAIREAGAIGTLVNHSEHQLKIAEIEKIVKKAKEKGFLTCVCANNIQTSKALATLGPSMVAMEPPELIGGNVSVTTKPDLVMKTVEAIKIINPSVVPLVGAGVKTQEDVKKAIQLGAKGVLLASGFVKAKNPKLALEDMADGILAAQK